VYFVMLLEFNLFKPLCTQYHGESLEKRFCGVAPHLPGETGEKWGKTGCFEVVDGLDFLLIFWENWGKEVKKLVLVELEYISCQRCGTPLVAISWVVEQAKRNLVQTRYGVSIHYLECEKCSQKWAIIILSDSEAWGFLQTPAQFAKPLYERVLQLRKAKVSVLQIRSILFHKSTFYIS